MLSPHTNVRQPSGHTRGEVRRSLCKCVLLELLAVLCSFPWLLGQVVTYSRAVLFFSKIYFLQLKDSEVFPSCTSDRTG